MLKRTKPERTAAPFASLVGLDEARRHLRVEATDDNVLIEDLVAAAESHLDGYAGVIGRALISQTWRERFSHFEYEMPLRVGPVQSITSITYYDDKEVEQTLDASVYRLQDAGGFAYLKQRDNQKWPSTFVRDDAVTVTYVCGYGDSAWDVPPAIRTAALMLVSHWFHHREAVMQGPAAPLPLGVDALLQPYRYTRSFYR